MNYRTLHNYGIQPFPTSPSKSSKSIQPPAKRARISEAKKAEKSSGASQAITLVDEEEEDILEDSVQVGKKSNAAGKRKWWWKFFSTTTLTTTWESGRGNKKKVLKDENYDCLLCTKFFRKASVLKGSTSALSSHIEVAHKRTEEGVDNSAVKQEGAMDQFVKGPKEIPPFEEALLSWIIDTNQPFTCTEKETFTDLMKAAGYSGIIKKGDTIKERIMDRLAATEFHLYNLFARTCSTCAISLDGWTSENSLSIFAIIATWADEDMKIYQAVIEFGEIEGSHSGQNLAMILYKAGKKLNINHKILSITGDNASNNDTCARHFHDLLS